MPTGALEFDASTFEIWGALLNGASLYLAHRDSILNFEQLKRVVKKQGVTIMWMTAALFNRVSDAGLEVFEGPRALLVGGDVLSPVHINRVRDRFPRLTMINGYGPTENTTFSTTFRIEKQYEDSIPIGKPIANSTAYILDRNNCPVPIGIVGELVVGGDGLARGYLNNPVLTADKFNRSYRTYRTYKTGDLARWLADGNIEFIGRIDSQVKIRGFRVEPGEIERLLVRHEYINDAVVIAREDKNGDKYLCAYVAAVRPGEVGPDEITAHLKNYLAHTLPAYMTPSYYALLDAIPLTSNGKVDRKALPGPELKIGTAYEAPRNGVEKQLAALWAEVLGIDEETAGIHDNFFDRGGHSLKATMLVALVNKTFGIKISLADIFRAPTIRQIAELLSVMDWAGKPGDHEEDVDPGEKEIIL
jgi:acyl-coenzyme A synthetase/AMP-(fatty) acid ligase/acyl carrier protein